MQKMGRVIFTIFGVGVGIYLLSKLKAGGKLEFYPKKIFTTGKLLQLKIFYQMEIVNSSSTPMKIDNMFLNVYDRNNQLGRIIVTTPIIIPPSSVTDFNFPIKLNGGAVVYFLYEVIAKGINKINLVGSLSTEGVTVPISKTLDFYS